MSRPRVVVLAEDLIWATRIATAIERAGGEPKRAKTPPEFERALTRADAAIVDLAARNYDALAAVQRSSRAGIRTLALGQHENLELRRRAFAAGADRVVTYNAFFRQGSPIVEGWLRDARERSPGDTGPLPDAAA